MLYHFFYYPPLNLFAHSYTPHTYTQLVFQLLRMVWPTVRMLSLSPEIPHIWRFKDQLFHHPQGQPNTNYFSHYQSNFNITLQTYLLFFLPLYSNNTPYHSELTPQTVSYTKKIHQHTSFFHFHTNFLNNVTPPASNQPYLQTLSLHSKSSILLPSTFSLSLITSFPLQISFTPRYITTMRFYISLLIQLHHSFIIYIGQPISMIISQLNPPTRPIHTSEPLLPALIFPFYHKFMLPTTIHTPTQLHSSTFITFPLPCRSIITPPYLIWLPSSCTVFLPNYSIILFTIHSLHNQPRCHNHLPPFAIHPHTAYHNFPHTSPHSLTWLISD
jgi:hypothetical protein